MINHKNHCSTHLFPE